MAIVGILSTMRVRDGYFSNFTQLIKYIIIEEMFQLYLPT